MSKDTVIKVENLSKQYLLNKSARPKSDTLYGNVFNNLKAIKDITKKKELEEFWALRDISFEIQKGDRVGVIGRNGAGKSTLLKVLSRIVLPTSGRIEYTGRMASLLEVGTGFHGDLSGRENIYLNGSILGMSKHEIDRKFDEIVAFSEIEKFLDTPVKRYSSGMYVRLAFAVAAHLEPEILIVDEVLAVGDADFQRKCLGKMKDVSNEGRTVLFVSHNMGAINSLCNKSIVLSKGTKVFEGSAQDGVNHYLKQNNSTADKTLLDRVDRIGNQNFMFTDIRFKNEKKELIQEILSGDYLEIELDYQTKDNFDLSKLIVSVAFMDDYQNIVLAFVSDEMGFKFSENSNKTMKLAIPRFLMRAYNYRVRLFASSKDTSENSICDQIENASQLQVLSRDFWNSGKIIREGCYPVIDGYYSL